MGLFVWK